MLKKFSSGFKYFRDPAPQQSNGASDSSITDNQLQEDEYALLANFDTVFLIDDSESMRGPTWTEIWQVLRSISLICVEHDEDGIDLYFQNHRTKDKGDSNCGKPSGGRRKATVVEIFEIFERMKQEGSAPTAPRLRDILGTYMSYYQGRVEACVDPSNCGVKPLNVIVFTDGLRTYVLRPALVSVARKLDELKAPPHQVGVQFFRVGRHTDAQGELNYLDNKLAKDNGVRDIVDTVAWTGVGERMAADCIRKTVLGAVAPAEV